jgi:hypothetical protein
MDRQDIAYLVNSTPNYYYLLKLHFTLLRRYAPRLTWPIYVVSEVPDDPVLQACVRDLDIKILPIEKRDRFFLESRLAGALALPEEIKYILPIQEDFLLDHTPMYDRIEEALHILDEDSTVSTIRLMPCPGPLPTAPYYKNSRVWKTVLGGGYIFTYQATLWRREDFCLFFSALVEYPIEALNLKDIIHLPLDVQKKKIQVDFNLAENRIGQAKFLELLGQKTHIGWVRKHSHPNAVYLCPWPYRPTAVEKGVLGNWAKELGAREGCSLVPHTEHQVYVPDFVPEL